MYWNSETFVCLFFEMEFYSNSDQPQTLNSSPVSASQKRLGLQISKAAFSGPWSDSRNLGLVQKLHFNGRVHTTPQQLAFQPPLAHHSAGTLSPHPQAVPSPAPDSDLQKGVLVASPYHGDHGGHRETTPQTTESNRLSLSVVTSAKLGISTPGDWALTSCPLSAAVSKETFLK